MQKLAIKKPETKKNLHVFSKCMAVLGMIIGVILIALFCVITIICKGPSPTAKDLFVTTVMETSAAKFLAYIYFSPVEIEQIISKNAVVEVDEITNNDDASNGFEPSETSVPKDTIEIIEVKKNLFKGKMMIVHDPSRVSVATTPVFGRGKMGTSVQDMVLDAGAIAGINGGGFADINGIGKGGQPLGVVIKDGVFLAGSLTEETTLAGFDQNNKLIVGKMTGQEAIDLKLRDAISFGPVFIVNGKAVETSGTGGGLNPRTVIGQRADGAVLLLAIDGRQASSLGASYSDCIEVMLEFGAVNACNLDGGSSTLMVYQDEIINVCASLYGPRKIPTAFIVK